MRRLQWFFTVMFLLLSTQVEGRESSFIRVHGTRFMQGNKPYFFTGVNMWYACILGSTPEGRRRLTAELDQLKSMGVLNLRVLAASEKSRLVGSIPDAIQISPGVCN
ncbi:MAG TPA: hypothetical protein VGB38_07245, partial [bacterium]